MKKPIVYAGRMQKHHCLICDLPVLSLAGQDQSITETMLIRSDKMSSYDEGPMHTKCSIQSGMNEIIFEMRENCNLNSYLFLEETYGIAMHVYLEHINVFDIHGNAFGTSFRQIAKSERTDNGWLVPNYQEARLLVSAEPDIENALTFKKNGKISLLKMIDLLEVKDYLYYPPALQNGFFCSDDNYPSGILYGKFYYHVFIEDHIMDSIKKLITMSKSME
ncbi:MAG: hypothetical protein R3B84_23275 [Zavarzinella sp.]